MLRGFDEADTLEKLSTQRELERMVEDDGVLICPLFVLRAYPINETRDVCKAQQTV